MTRVRDAAHALAELSLEAFPGAHLGGEDELLDRLGVSRPTLRQAAKIVEADRLLQVRRGTRGGFFAARPDAADVIRAPARYLRLNGATIADVHSVTRLIAEQVAALAAACTDPAPLAELAAFRDRIEAADSVPAMIRSETELARLLARMSGNPAAELFIEIGYTFGREEHHLHFYQSDEDRAQARSLQRKLCDAVLAGDAEVARLMIRRRADLIAGWLARDLAVGT
ncbi:FadR/GntR family transcriptional regulator [Sphingomonas sp. 179-A 2A2 NHS]|jgi:DNA-binding FadR family transcriptional regulator|uniref:FadR/GntR family transcriptional regulator n=1 Tax=Sphingomonas sp. 179-A 2A2 NHS TaxID=3374290 RepID=UPI0038792507